MITEDSIILVTISSSEDDSDTEEDVRWGRPLTNYNIKFYHKNDKQRKKELGVYPVYRLTGRQLASMDIFRHLTNTVEI